MENMWLVFFWTGPIGIGVFLALLGSFIYLLAKADEIRSERPDSPTPAAGMASSKRTDQPPCDA